MFIRLGLLVCQKGLRYFVGSVSAELNDG